MCYCLSHLTLLVLINVFITQHLLQNTWRAAVRAFYSLNKVNITFSSESKKSIPSVVYACSIIKKTTSDYDDMNLVYLKRVHDQVLWHTVGWLRATEAGWANPSLSGFTGLLRHREHQVDTKSGGNSISMAYAPLGSEKANNMMIFP